MTHWIQLPLGNNIQASEGLLSCDRQHAFAGEAALLDEGAQVPGAMGEQAPPLCSPPHRIWAPTGRVPGDSVASGNVVCGVPGMAECAPRSDLEADRHHLPTVLLLLYLFFPRHSLLE